MKAKIIKTLFSTGSAARDFIRSVYGVKRTPVMPIPEERTPPAASDVLESFRANRKGPIPSPILTGKRVIAAMDEQLREYGSAGEQFADWITRGCRVSISGDDRPFTVMGIWWEDEAIKLKDDEGHTYVVPFKVIGPWPREEGE